MKFEKKILEICDALHDQVPFVQFKKRKKYSRRSVTFSKVTFFHGCFSRFLNSANSTKLRKTSFIGRIFPTPSVSSFSAVEDVQNFSDFVWTVIFCTMYSDLSQKTKHGELDKSSMKYCVICIMFQKVQMNQSMNYL